MTQFALCLFPICLFSAVLGVKSAYAIVSDRHLQGVRALECDLESAQSEFRLLVNVSKRSLRLEDEPSEIAYEEVSDHTMRFPLTLPQAAKRTCDLQFPAGALVCTSKNGQADFGFCLTIP
ncbi:MAG: hypothetical protein GTO41_05865 [Burkholderiales bacterium]|nr:hypothetical protein [Burkholderiales bacterium]